MPYADPAALALVRLEAVRQALHGPAAVREAAAEVYGAEAQVLQIARAGYRGDFWAWVARFEPQMDALRAADRKLKNLRRRARRWEGKP